jgi:hypothetical protein
VTKRDDLLTRLRADPRVDVVVRAFVAQRLGLLGDDADLLGDRFDDLVTELHRIGTAASLVVGATRLLDHLDAQLARAHPVDLEWTDDGAAEATVLTDADDRVTATLVPADPNHGVPTRVVVGVDDHPLLVLGVDDAEVLAYALLRLVREAAIVRSS